MNTKILSTQSKTYIFTAIRVSTAFLFLFLCSNFVVFLPNLTPVPLTMHTFAALSLGMMLPYKEAFAVFLSYMSFKLFGCPGFGMTLIIGNYTFGYLVGMIIAMYFLSKIKAYSKVPLILSLLVADLIISVFGVFNMSFTLGWEKAILLGFYPFIIGNLFKVFLAYGLIQAKGIKRFFQA